MNINKFLTGGVAAQQVALERNAAAAQQMTEIFLAIAANPAQAILMLQLQGVDPQQIMLLVQQQALAGNPAAREALSAIALMQLQSQMAKYGTKLEYIRRIKGGCPEGYEKQIFKKGGSLGCGCVKKELAGGETTIDKFKKDRAKKACKGAKFFK